MWKPAGKQLFPIKFIRKSRGGNIVKILLLVFIVCLTLACSQQKNQSLAVGDKAPDFSVADLDGNVFTLSDNNGAPTILRFFLTDCKFCRADTPVFIDYYNRFHSKGLRILYIDTLNIDADELNSFKKALNIPFPVASESDGKIAAGYRVNALPVTIVLDPNLKILAAILGGVSKPELDSLLSPYLSLDK